MNPKHYGVRMDRDTGDIWLTEEKYAKPVKRLKNITGDVILALAADITVTGGTKEASRDIKFSDGGHIRLTVTDLNMASEQSESVQSDELGSAALPEE